MDEPTWAHVHPQMSLAMDKSTPEQVHLEASVAMGKSMLQQAHLAVSVAVGKTTTQQVSEGTSEGTVADGEGCIRAGTPQRDCGCGCPCHTLLLPYLVNRNCLNP